MYPRVHPTSIRQKFLRPFYPSTSASHVYCNRTQERKQTTKKKKGKTRGHKPTMTASDTHLRPVGCPNYCAHRLLHVRRDLLLRRHKPHAFGDQLAVELENIICLYREILANDLFGYERCSDDGSGRLKATSCGNNL